MTKNELPYRERLALIRQGLAEKTTGPKPKKYIPKKSAKRIKEDKEEKDGRKKEGNKLDAKIALDVWFRHKVDKHWGNSIYCPCMECGAAIRVDYARHATAHLLPKKLFKSVATHELNYLILGAGCGCHSLTDRVDKFVTMRVWPEAARRIKEMIPLLPFDELKYLSSQLMTALENI